MCLANCVDQGLSIAASVFVTIRIFWRKWSGSKVVKLSGFCCIVIYNCVDLVNVVVPWSWYDVDEDSFSSEIVKYVNVIIDNRRVQSLSKVRFSLISTISSLVRSVLTRANCIYSIQYIAFSFQTNITFNSGGPSQYLGIKEWYIFKYKTRIEMKE